ncbi:MAG: hypothetical protein AAF969_01535 [Bacteroidota bacterium]
MMSLTGAQRIRVKLLLTFTVLFFCHTLGFSQIDELVNQVDAAERGAERIGNSIFTIIKIAAAVLVIIAGLAFLIIREQNSDMARKVGNLIIGLVIFYALVEVGENMTN